MRTELNDSYNYFLKEYSPFLLVLIFLLILATLFPPYNWGNERLRTKEERGKYVRNIGYINDILPIKGYDFLLSNSKKEIFIGWGYSKNESTKKYIILERHLITEELILNYLLSLFIAVAIFLFSHKLKHIFMNRKLIILILVVILIIFSILTIFNFVREYNYKKVIVTEKIFEEKSKVYSRDSNRDRTRDRSRDISR